MDRPVTVYTRPGCIHCELAKAYLTERHVPYQERDVSRDDGALQELRAIGAPGVPVVVIDQQAVVGFDKPRLDDLLKARQHFTGHPAQVF
jgi:glutaredoxin 3